MRQENEPDFPELTKKYLILDESPDYFLLSRDFPISEMNPKQFVMFTKYAFKKHKEFWK